MALNLMYITNNVQVALIAEKYGVNRIFIDLETLGKEERQKNLNSVKSHHSILDVENISQKLTKSQLLVRINPWHKNSVLEIEKVIKAGADIIMLPMWTSLSEVESFIKVVNNRAKTLLLLETKGAYECIDSVLKTCRPDEIHIGLNDLHLSFGMTFMFEPLTNGMVESLCDKFNRYNLNYGFGGIAKLGCGDIPAEKIIMEHYRLGSKMAILSRSFCNVEELNFDLDKIENVFSENMVKLREFENSLLSLDKGQFLLNKQDLALSVKNVVETRKRR